MMEMKHTYVNKERRTMTFEQNREQVNHGERKRAEIGGTEKEPNNIDYFLPSMMGCVTFEFPFVIDEFPSADEIFPFPPE